MFNTKGKTGDSGFKTGKYVGIGPNKLKITGFTHKPSKAGDKFKIVVNFESKPITEDGWEGQDGALGQIGRSDIGIYTNGTDQAMDGILKAFVTIAETLGVRDQLDAIQASKIEEYLDKVSALVNNKFAWWLIGGEEYMGQDQDGNDKVKFVLKIPRFGFIAESEEGLQKKMKGGEFPIKGDPNAQWFFKNLEAMDEDEMAEKAGPTEDGEDLPF